MDKNIREMERLIALDPENPGLLVKYRSYIFREYPQWDARSIYFSFISRLPQSTVALIEIPPIEGLSRNVELKNFTSPRNYEELVRLSGRSKAYDAWYDLLSGYSGRIHQYASFTGLHPRTGQEDRYLRINVEGPHITGRVFFSWNEDLPDQANLIHYMLSNFEVPRDNDGDIGFRRDFNFYNHTSLNDAMTFVHHVVERTSRENYQMLVDTFGQEWLNGESDTPFFIG